MGYFYQGILQKWTLTVSRGHTWIELKNHNHFLVKK